MAASTTGVGISRDFVRANVGKFKDYCPVSLLDDHKLIKALDELFLVAEYKVLYE